MNVRNRRIVQLVNQNDLQEEYWEHDVELSCGHKTTRLKDISKDDNLIQQNHDLSYHLNFCNS